MSETNVEVLQSTGEIKLTMKLYLCLHNFSDFEMDFLWELLWKIVFNFVVISGNSLYV